MITRHDILCKAADDCMKELYSLAYPSIEWEEFEKECKIYSDKYKIWEEYNNAEHKKDKNPTKWEIEQKKHPYWENKSITECIGPKPYEFYFLPREIMKDVCDSYVHAYKMDNQQELLDTIKTLKNYCKKPIVDKYINDWTDEDGFHYPGYRSYDHPDNLEKEIKKILGDVAEDNEYYQHKLQDKFFEFLDMAGSFFNWNSELNSFSMTVYLGASPCSNKQTVIDNWKQYRNKDIVIDEEKIKKDYYGDDDESCD